jgi:hypothetical protein
VALIVEVLDSRTGEVRTRARLDAGPVTIGRAFDNDIVLDDPYADARHARIVTDETGLVAIEDLGSVNALATSYATGLSRVVVGPEVLVRVGRTRLRFRDAAAPLPPALRDLPVSPARERLGRWAGTWWGQLAATAAAMVAVGWMTWLGTFTESPATQVVSTAFGVLALLGLWAGVWAVASRIVVHRFRFLGHLAVASAVTLAGIVVAAADQWAGFLFPDSGWLGPLGGAVVLLLVAALVAGHLALSSGLNGRRRWIAGFVTSGVLLAILGVFTAVEDEGFSDVPAFSATLKPFPARWLPTATVPEFEQVEDDLRQAVDALAERE